MNCDVQRRINLYTVWDSYLYDFLDKKFYCGVDSIFQAKTNIRQRLITSLNPKKKNILLVEIAERNLQKILTDTAYLHNLFELQTKDQGKAGQSTEKAGWMSKLYGFIFNKKIDANLESNIWGYSFFTPIKKFKADINYKVFNVINSDVVLSPDKKHLFYTPTTDSSDSSSSFHPVSDDQIKFFIVELNQLYDHSKNLGFKEVYLALVPNPVSILSPNYHGLKYNNLLSRIQNSPDLRIPVIDIYSTFVNSPVEVYYRSDSHWNMDGAYLWFQKLNAILVSQSRE